MNGSARWHLVRPILDTDTELWGLWHEERKAEAEMKGQALDTSALYYLLQGQERVNVWFPKSNEYAEVTVHQGEMY